MSFFPSEDEKVKVQLFIKDEIKSVKSFLNRYNLPYVDVVVVGSTAKDTFLSGDFDVDIFIITPNVDDVFEKIKLFRSGNVKLGELKIWHYIKDGFDVDLVVVHPEWSKINTLKHTDFYKKQLTDEMKNEVRKAKALFKSYGVYGAEIGGITGIALEELIRLHGNLENACKILIKSKGKIWLQDPTSNRPRNLLASVMPYRWNKIFRACKNYLSSKTIHYKKYTSKQFIAEKKNETFSSILLFERKRDKAVDFMTGLSICNKTCNELKNFEEDIQECKCDVYVNSKNIYVSFKVKPEKLSSFKLRCIYPQKAPPDAIEQFKKQHPNWFKKDNKICVIVPRKIADAKKFMINKITEKMSKRTYWLDKILNLEM